MEQFTFNRDVKCTVWTREKYIVEAENAEEAKRLFIKRYKANNLCSDDFEYLYDTVEETNKEEFLDEDGNTFSIED